MLEKTVETYLVDRVRAAGGDAYKFTSPARVSVPDRIVVFPPARIYFVELKRPGGKLTRGQEREHARLRAFGCDVRTLDSREAVDAFVQKVRDGLIGDDRALLVEAWNFGQFADDADWPQAKRIRAALRRLCAALAHESLISESVIKDSAPKVSQAPADERAACEKAYQDCAANRRTDENSFMDGWECAVEWLQARASSANETGAEGFTYATKQATVCASCGEHKHTPLRIDWMGGYVCLTCIDRELESRAPAQAAEPLVLTGAEFSTDTVREAVEQGLWAADVKLTDDAWRNIEALLVEQARVDALKAFRARGAA